MCNGRLFYTGQSQGVQNLGLWGRAAGGSGGQRGFRKDLAVRGHVAVDIVMGRPFFVRRLASKVTLAAWLSRADHLETMAVSIFEGPQIIQNDLSWFKNIPCRAPREYLRISYIHGLPTFIYNIYGPYVAHMPPHMFSHMRKCP